MDKVNYEKYTLKELEDIIEDLKKAYEAKAEENDLKGNELSKYSICKNEINSVRSQIREMGLFFPE